MYRHYPFYIRLWHLLNALFFLCLIVTGLDMQFSDPDHPLISMPASVNLHKICGIALTINYFLFFIGNIISSNGKNYLVRFRGLLKKILLQVRYYITRSWKKTEPPFPISADQKFNPLQALAYSKTMYILVPLVIITGVGLMFPKIIIEKLFGISGLLITDITHVITGFILFLFMLVHIYMSTLGKTPSGSFRAIITGWQEIEEVNSEQ
jgi:thiosulfate reductase cytochrome b subunit